MVYYSLTKGNVEQRNKPSCLEILAYGTFLSKTFFSFLQKWKSTPHPIMDPYFHKRNNEKNSPNLRLGFYKFILNNTSTSSV